MLLDLLRDRLGLTGTKRSCDTQVCGACTVLLDGAPVSACCTLAYEADGRAVETIEGLASAGGLHPIQQAFVDQRRHPVRLLHPRLRARPRKRCWPRTRTRPATEIESYLGGNLCRCTGYWNILDAVETAAAGWAHPHPQPLSHCGLTGGGSSMKSAVLRQTEPLSPRTREGLE